MSAVANAIALTWCRITVPWSGCALVEMQAPEPVLPVAGLVTVLMGDLSVSCALVPSRSGDFAGRWSGYAVAGRNGWDKPATAKGYASPFGVINAQVIQDAARDSGELPPVIATPLPMGPFYSRIGGRPYSQVFAKLPAFTDWWVDPATGITQVAPRPPLTVALPFEIVNVANSAGRVTIATDNPAQFAPNATFIDPQAGVFTVNAAVWTSDGEKMRGEIWTA